MVRPRKVADDIWRNLCIKTSIDYLQPDQDQTQYLSPESAADCSRGNLQTSCTTSQFNKGVCLVLRIFTQLGLHRTQQGMMTVHK